MTKQLSRLIVSFNFFGFLPLVFRHCLDGCIKRRYLRITQFLRWRHPVWHTIISIRMAFKHPVQKKKWFQTCTLVLFLAAYFKISINNRKKSTSLSFKNRMLALYVKESGWPSVSRSPVHGIPDLERWIPFPEAWIPDSRLTGSIEMDPGFHRNPWILDSGFQSLTFAGSRNSCTSGDNEVSYFWTAQ